MGVRMSHRDRLLLPCLRGVVGDWVYYSSVMSSQAIASRIRPAGDLRETKALEDYLQRDLQTRVDKIVAYLRGDPSHFFPSLIVGVFGSIPDWYALDLRASEIAGGQVTDSEADSLSDTIGLLHLTGREEMFAIDGQHRVAALAKAWRSVTEAERDTSFTADDQFSVVLVAHRDDIEGKRRSRRLFADINKRAVQVSPGDLAIMDEEDVSIIAARRIYAEYSPFQGRISLTPQGNLDADDRTHITNLLTLVQVNKRLKRLWKKKRGTKEWEEENVVSMYSIAAEFYDFLLNSLTILWQCLVENRPTVADLRFDRRHLVSRPVGLVLLAQLYAWYSERNNLSVLKTKLGLLNMDLAGGHFNNVLWSGGKMEPRNRKVAFELCRYLFDDSGVDVNLLTRDYRRIVKDPSAQLPAQV